MNKWIRNPSVFLEIIDKYGDSLPSDATLRFDLIGQGFNPTAAEALIPIFKRSADLVGLYGDTVKARVAAPPENLGDPETESTGAGTSTDASLALVAERPDVSQLSASLPKQTFADTDRHDQIPVRLSKGRRAMLVIPYPFYDEDKKRLIAQIELLLTDEG